MTSVKIEVEDGPDALLIRVSGEIDVTNVGHFSDELHRAAANGAGVVAVDLEGVTYLDSAGIRTLFEFARTLEMARQDLVLVVPEGRPLRRLLSITGMAQVARIVPSVDEAIARGASPT